MAQRSATDSGLQRPIGMFDSGFGGLTVARALIDLMPEEALVYVGDTARYPYGPKPLEEVRSHAIEIADYLIERHGVKALVVACNTASAVALDELAERHDVPVFGVIEPGVDSVLSVSANGRVGVIGTVGTVSSGAYQQAVAARQVSEQRIELTCAACPGFVEFVEKGITTGDQVRVLAERLLAPIVDAKVDALLLGCTHYPFLARTIGEVMGREVVLVSSADETAFAVRRRLLDDGLAAQSTPPIAHDTAEMGETVSKAKRRWVSSGDVEWFRSMGRQLLGPELDAVEAVQWPWR